MNPKIIIAGDVMPTETKMRISLSDVLSVKVVDGMAVLHLSVNGDERRAQVLLPETLRPDAIPTRFPLRGELETPAAIVTHQVIDMDDPAIYINKTLCEQLKVLPIDPLMGNGPAEDPTLLLAVSITRNGVNYQTKVMYSKEDQTARVLTYDNESANHNTSWWEPSCWTTIYEKTALTALQAAIAPVRLITRKVTFPSVYGLAGPRKCETKPVT